MVNHTLGVVQNVTWTNAVRILNTTTINQALGMPGLTSTFTASQLFKLRVTAISAAAASITVGIIAMLFLSGFDKRKKLFRHDLILFLIICDFLKAMILALYPVIILANNRVYATPTLFNILGWFTAFAIEGADIAIFVFAIHFGLLIFRPNWKWRNKRTGNIEGGLFKYKAFIWPLTLTVPAFMASLVFIDYNVIDYEKYETNVNVILDNNNYDFNFKPRRGGYKPWSAWCYLPATPLWYKYVLSWGPRYFLILFIFGMYIAIYVYVLREGRRIKAQLNEFQGGSRETTEEPSLEGLSKYSIFFIYLKRYLFNPILYVLEYIKNFFSLSLEDYSDDSIESRKSYSLTNFYYQDNSNINHSNNHNNQKNQKNNKHNHNYNDDDNNNNSNDNHKLNVSIRHPDFENEFSDLEDVLDFSSVKNEIHEQRSSNQNVFVDPFESEFKADASPLRKPYPAETKLPSSYAQRNLQDSSMETDEVNRMEEINDVQLNFQKQTYANMKKRRSQIQKNLRSIFIYPCSYIGIWLFPIIADISQTNHEMVHGPILWLSYIDTFIRPLSCLVHAFVFIFRERPWRHAWSNVESQMMTERYILKGEIGEDEILRLCNSKLGKEGWYYRSTWNKKRCWKHQPETWKRLLWYVRRFIKGVFTFKLNFEDNCNDDTYWQNYYLVNRVSTPDESISSSFNNNIPEVNVMNHTRGDSKHSSILSDYSNNKEMNSSKYTNVSIWWKFVHLIPMLHGIDLDELNRSIKLQYTENDDFVIPGLKFALNNSPATTTTNNNNIKIDNNNNNNDDNKNNNNNIPKSATFGKQGSFSNKSQVGSPSHPSEFAENIPLKSLRRDSYIPAQEQEDDGQIDLLAFLNGPHV